MADSIQSPFQVFVQLESRDFESKQVEANLYEWIELLDSFKNRFIQESVALRCTTALLRLCLELFHLQNRKKDSF